MPSIKRRKQVSDAVRARLWPVPMIGVVLAIGAGVGLPALDRVVDKSLPHVRPIADAGLDDARELLGTISTALITVTSLTFSLTVVTLQLASGQYSPRLLRTFARDRFVQRTMGLFLATFAYSITLLHNVRNGPGQTPDGVPQISVSLAAALALLSVVALVFFLAHLVSEIRVETMMDTVCADAISAGSDVFEALDSADDSRSVPRPPADAAVIAAPATGFLVSVDEDSLVSAAAQADVVVFINRPPGDWLIAGDPLAFAWAREPNDNLEGQRLEKLSQNVSAAVRTGSERTPVQDVGYGLRQLTDVAVKALSPGVNDPTTAVHALGYSSALLCNLTRRRLNYKALRRDDVTRAVIRQPNFSELLDLAVAQPRRYGADDPALLARLFILLREVAWQVTNHEQKSAIAGQLARLRRTVARQDFDDVERNDLSNLEHQVEAAIVGDWRPAH